MKFLIEQYQDGRYWDGGLWVKGKVGWMKV